jgi:hypothetical protein
MAKTKKIKPIDSSFRQRFVVNDCQNTLNRNIAKYDLTHMRMALKNKRNIKTGIHD